MKKVMFILLVVGIFSLSAQGFSFNASEDGVSMTITGDETSDSTTQLKSSNSAIDEIANRLEKLQKLYTGQLSKMDGRRADKIVDEIYTLLVSIEGEGTASTGNTSTNSSSTINININDDVTPNITPTTPTPEPEVTKAMPNSDFSTLVSRIESESFSDDKLRVLRTAANNYSFNVNQIVRLIGLYDFSEEQLKALELSYPGCVDAKNNYKILDAFTYSSDKDEAEKIINNN